MVTSWGLKRRIPDLGTGGKSAGIPVVGYFAWTINIVWFALRYAVGKLINALGLPGFVADGMYEADISKAHIKVWRSALFTVISVNGLDIYFFRLTGKIDGVGFSPSADCTPDLIPGSIGSGVKPAEGLDAIHN